MATELKPIGWRLPVALLGEVREYASTEGLTVTSAVIVLLRRGLRAARREDASQ